MSEETGSGKWVAAVGGAGVGAGAAYASSVAMKVQGGPKAFVADKVHEVISKFKTPEALAKFAEPHFETLKGHLTAAEAQIAPHWDQVSKGFQTAMGETTGMDAETLAKHGDEFVVMLQEQLAAIKNSKFAELPNEIWTEAHAHLQKITPALEKVGFKRSLISKVPGGIGTITGAGAVLGAAIAYMAIDNVEKSAKASATSSRSA